MTIAELRVLITAENKDAIAKIIETQKATDGLGDSFKKMPDHTNRATMALSDFSRIAQDAPYGIRGIANNLNPMLESFQRLSKDAGGTGAALKAMVASLAGPAGLGVAVGAVSSLLVVFSDKIFKASESQTIAAEKAKEHTDQIKAQKAAIDSIYSSQAAEETKVLSLIAVLESETITRDKKLRALEDLKKINPEIFAGVKIEFDGIVGLNVAYEKYVANITKVIALKIKQKELEDLITENLKKQPAYLTNEDKAIKKTGEALKERMDIFKTEDQLRSESTKKYSLEHAEILKTNTFLDKQKRILEEIKELAGNVDVSPEKDPSKSKATKKPFDWRLAILKRTHDIGAGIPKAPDEVDETYGFPNPSAIGNMFGKAGNAQNSGSFKAGKSLLDAFFKGNNKNFDEANKQAERFANTLANTTTNAIRGMWDSMQRGENILESLGNAFLKLAEDIAFAILKAEILAAINKATGIASPAAAAGAAGGGGLLSLLSKLLSGGLASGGIVTSPTLTMVGEGNEHEAVMPLSKLSSMMSSTFNAGSMSGNGNQGSSQFVLRGQDLLVALNRTQKASNLKGQNISLA